MTLMFRSAGAQDTTAIRRLLDDLGYPLDPQTVATRLRAATSHGHIVLIAELGGEVVGLTAAATVPLLAEGGRMIRITALSVAPAARRRGVGAALSSRSSSGARAAR